MNQDLSLSSPSSNEDSLISHKTYRKWVVWSLAALFYLYETFLRVAPSVMTESLMEDFGVTSTSLGVLTSCYYYAYVPLQIPCGLIVDRLGIRFILTFSCFCCMLGTLLFAISEQLWMAQLGRFILGAGSACAFISCLKITVEWFSPLKFALVAGLTNMMGTLGGLAAGRPLAMFVNHLGWRPASIYLGLLGLPIMLLIWWYLKHKPQPIKDPQNSEKESTSSLLSLKKGLQLIVKNHIIWIAGIAGGLMYIPISAFAELWGVPFFMQTQSMDNESASSISHMIFVGMALGSPAAAWCLKFIPSIPRIMQLSALCAAILFACIAYSIEFPLAISYILIFLAGLAIGGQVLCFTISKNESQELTSGTAIGFTNALVMLSGIIFQPLLGHILDIFWEGNFSQAGVRIYSNSAYQLSILTIPVCFILSIALLQIIKGKSYTEKV